MKMNRVNLGEIIHQIVREKGWSDAEFAKNLNIARQNIKKTVFEKHSLDTDLLCSICEVLDCNLFDYFSACNQNDYPQTPKEIKAKITIEMGAEKQDKTFRFVFGQNKVEIK